MQSKNTSQNILYQDNNGYVVHCSCCDTFRIAYGTIAFDQSESSLLSLMNILEAYYLQYNGLVEPSCRCIQIVTPFNGFRLLFSIEDLQLFGNMLQESYLLFRAERTMNE